MKFLKKVLRLLRQPKILVRKIINKLPKQLRGWVLKFPAENSVVNQIDYLLMKHKDKEIYIFPLPTCPWGYMFQRPQQLARALAKEGNVVFYLVDTTFPFAPDWDVRGIKEIETNLYLYNDNVSGKWLLQSLKNVKVNVWQYWPHQNNIIRQWETLHPNINKIYDCIDYLDTFDHYDEIEKDFIHAVTTANMLLATAKIIKEDLKKYRQDIIYVPNAVAIEDFAQFITYDWPELEMIMSEKRQIIGYYGAIAEWFDFELVEYIAKKNPEYIVLLVGEVYEGVADRVKHLNSYENIRFLKRVDYKFIPQLLNSFNVAILPFVINNITLSTSPVKVFEYLAGGKSVVSSALPEVVDIDCILIGHNKYEFNEQIKEAILLQEDEGFIRQMKKVAEENTWENRVKKILN